MASVDKKAAIAAYKEKKIEGGVYAFACKPTGQVWVGTSPNLAQAPNRIKFDLGLGKHRNTTLQAAWNEHGADSFSFEVSEVIDSDTPDFAKASLLKTRLAAWADTLAAEPI